MCHAPANLKACNVQEFIDFWLQVRANGYSEDQLYEEMEQMLEGGTYEPALQKEGGMGGG